MFDKVSNALLTLLSANTLIQSKYDFEASKLEGFPALTITPSESENEYSTTTENRRVYSFVVRLYVERSSGNNAEQTTEKTMRQLVDTVLDTIDKNHSSLNAASQTGYTFLMIRATPSRWGYAGRDNVMRVAEVRISVEYDVDTNLIT